MSSTSPGRTKIVYDCYGAGPAVILLHAGGGKPPGMAGSRLYPAPARRTPSARAYLTCK